MFDCKEYRFLPQRDIKDFRLQRFVSSWISDFGNNPFFNPMRGVPFLKLLVLERVSGSVARAHQHVVVGEHIKHRIGLRLDRDLTVISQQLRCLGDRSPCVVVGNRGVPRSCD